MVNEEEKRMKSQWKKLLGSIGIFVGCMIAFLVLTFLFGDGEKVITDFQFTEKIAIENDSRMLQKPVFLLKLRKRKNM